MSDYDIYTKCLKYTEEETQEMLGRLKVQKLEELKIQVLSQNPQLMGVGIPGDDNKEEPEIGVEPGGPTLNLEAPQEMGENTPEGQQPVEESPESPETQKSGNLEPIPEPNKEDVKKYGLEIQDYSAEMDDENPDYSTEY